MRQPGLTQQQAAMVLPKLGPLILSGLLPGLLKGRR